MLRRGPDVDLTKYTSEDFAAWWLRDDYTIGGIGCNSEDKAFVISRLVMNKNYDFVRLVKNNDPGKILCMKLSYCSSFPQNKIIIFSF